MIKQNFKKHFDNLILDAKRVVITTHENPDGDALCSALAVKDYLQKIHPKKESKIYIADKPQDSHLLNLKSIQWTDNLESVLQPGDLVVFLDGNRLNRFTPNPEKINLVRFKSVCIDHHQGKPENFTLKLIDLSAIAVCQIIADVLFKNNKFLDSKTIKILLIGIISDSGFFQYINFQSVNSLVTVKRLIKLGNIDLQSLIFKMNQIQSKEFKIIKSLINNTKSVPMTNFPCLTYSYLEKSEIKQFSKETIDAAKEKYTFYFIRKIKDCPWGFTVTPRGQVFRLSFRSLPEGPDVSQIVRQHFHGGGHARAAGGRFIPDKKEAQIDSVEVCQKILRILKSIK